MAQKTIELEVGRGREMGVDGNPSLSPIAPFDIVEPDMNTEHMLINIGPQHPATHGVLRLVCELDGETVKRVVPDIGYLHSSFE
jgi:NADH-quinone oxidoreductase subunit D